jgi:hypothetical protein
MIAIRSIASVQSYYFRELLAECAEHTTLADHRRLWRRAHAQAIEWRRRATTPFPTPLNSHPDERKPH